MTATSRLVRGGWVRAEDHDAHRRGNVHDAQRERVDQRADIDYQNSVGCGLDGAGRRNQESRSGGAVVRRAGSNMSGAIRGARGLVIHVRADDWMALHATLREMYGVLLEEREPHGDAKFAVQQLTGLTMTVGRLMGAMVLRGPMR